MTTAREIMTPGAQCIGEDDRLQGVVTDRDIVARCLAIGTGRTARTARPGTGAHHRSGDDVMATCDTCDTCGNDYDKTFTVTQGDRRGTFDSFECAAHAMAPTCEHCGCRVLGHGVESGNRIYCCAHCAEHAGVGGLTDRV
ncbi:hypothetical protein ACH9EU_10905 [Kocuria sp. M1R5S2]|uniref:hypothetical protein n=1 Tax=Kocuria rhizosphaerae TaxID=3376285 RepID=UPI0037B724CE